MKASEINELTDDELAREAIRLAAMKLPIKAKFVKREEDPFEGQ